MRILLPVIFLCAAAFGEDGMIAIKSNKPDTIIQVRKEITSEGKVTQLWINIGTTSKDGSYLLLKMPIGVHRIKLSKDGYLPIITNITVDKKINKIEYELDKEMNDINIIFLHEGWQVYVDGNPYLDDDKPVFAPTSIMVSKEKHEIRLVKGGFNDIVKNVDVNKVVGNGSNCVVEFNDKPVEGRSTIVKKEIVKKEEKEKDTIEKRLKKAVVGKWMASHANGWSGSYIINLDGTVREGSKLGNWEIKNKNLEFIWDNNLKDIFQIKDDIKILNGVNTNGLILKITKIGQ
jgi:hypothetical protein